jgi:hypothetical protein
MTARNLGRWGDGVVWSDGGCGAGYTGCAVGFAV